MLERRGAAIEVERSTERPLSTAEAKRLLASVDRVLLLRGAALKELDAKSVKPDDLKGPTGKIRAPLVRVGRTLLAGFRPEALERLLDESGQEISGARPSAASRNAKSKAVSRSLS